MQQEVSDDLSICILNLEFVWEKIKIKGKHLYSKLLDQEHFLVMLHCSKCFSKFRWGSQAFTHKKEPQRLCLKMVVCFMTDKFFSNKNLVNLNYHWKNWVDGISTKWEKGCNLFIKNLYFEKKVPNIKKHLHLNFLTTFQKTFIFHDHLPQFYF